MKKLALFFTLSLFVVNITTKAQIQGIIKKYSKQPLQLYRCLGDSLVWIDSTHTNTQGEFEFNITTTLQSFPRALYRINLQRNQWFYVLNDGYPVKVKTVYLPSPFDNIATDSLEVVKSEVNKKFYEFQRLQKSLVIANTWLLQMIRLYPISDPFHPTIEKEYLKRHEAMDKFAKTFVQPSAMKKTSMAAKIALAYYTPLHPDWKEPDPWRDSIIAAHYFDYFNPADSFYLQTNILPEKIDHFLKLRINKRDNYGQPINDPNLLIQATKDFLDKTRPNYDNLRFCLNYLLKISIKEHKDDLFLALYDTYLQTQEGDCGSQQDDWTWAREKANLLRGVQIGSTAPEFSLQDGLLSLSSIQSNYTLLIFWSSWCPHCTEEIPKIKKITDEINTIYLAADKKLTVIAISLDTDHVSWQKYVQENNLLTWFNTSELKGWKGEVPKRYNVYATPSMFLLDGDKKIIAKPENAEQLLQMLKKM